MCVILGFESSITNQKQHNLTCPHCGKKLLRIIEGSTVRKVYVWCKICKKEIEIDLQATK